MVRRSFLDTNVLIYSVDRADPAKQETALGLIARHAKERFAEFTCFPPRETHSMGGDNETCETPRKSRQGKMDPGPRRPDRAVHPAL
jgi:hypothetical protein